MTQRRKEKEKQNMERQKHDLEHTLNMRRAEMTALSAKQRVIQAQLKGIPWAPEEEVEELPPKNG